MSLQPLSPMLPAPSPRRRPGWTFGLSMALHAALVAALLLLVRRPTADGPEAPSYELMFDSGNGPAPPPRGTPAGDAGPAAAQPPPAASTPAPDALAGPPTPPAETPPTAASQPLPQAEPTPPPPAAAPPQPAPPPQVRLDQPPAEAPPRPATPDFVMPTPPEPLAPPEPRPAPRPPQPRPPQPRPQSTPPTAGTFANPMDLNFAGAGRLPAPRLNAPRGSVASRSLDLSPGYGHAEPNRAEAFFDQRAAKLGKDWQNGLEAYWLSHRYYPRQAIEDHESGDVDVELTVDRTGRVTGAVLKSRSGSSWIDMAALGTWRNAQLQPLPPELGDHYTFSISISYILLMH